MNTFNLLNNYNTYWGNNYIGTRNPPLDGNMTFKVTVPPLIEPVTVNELKEFARIDSTDEDTTLLGFIKASRHGIEQYLGRSLIRQTITVSLDTWSYSVLKLPRPPLLDVFEVRTIDEDDVPTIYDYSNYYIRTDIEPGQIVIKSNSSFPINDERSYGGFEVEYWAGYGSSASDVPQMIIEGIKLWATGMYENRTFDPVNIPPTVRAVVDGYKVIKI